MSQEISTEPIWKKKKHTYNTGLHVLCINTRVEQPSAICQIIKLSLMLCDKPIASLSDLFFLQINLAYCMKPSLLLKC